MQYHKFHYISDYHVIMKNFVLKQNLPVICENPLNLRHLCSNFETA
jgi:hypothetical protein